MIYFVINNVPKNRCSTYISNSSPPAIPKITTIKYNTICCIPCTATTLKCKANQQTILTTEQIAPRCFFFSSVNQRCMHAHMHVLVEEVWHHYYYYVQSQSMSKEWQWKILTYHKFYTKMSMTVNGRATIIIAVTCQMFCIFYCVQVIF